MIYVIGKNGYIASNLIPYLREKGHEVQGYSRADEWKWDDFEKCKIINCTSYGSKPGQEYIPYLVERNFTLAKEIYCAAPIPEKMIHLSSSSEIFQPHTAYARTKSLASDYLRGKATLCYIYTPYGGINQHEHTFMAALLKAKRDNLPFHVEHPYATRDFVHIKHICRGIEELIDKPIGEYHFGMGKARLMQDVARMAKVPYTHSNDFNTFTWKAKEPYFTDTFQEDLAEELCGL